MNFCRVTGDVRGTNACAAATMASEAQMKMLYESHGPALLRYLGRAFGDCGPPEDLLQETFVAALGAKENCLKAASPRAFLFGIARHVGMDARRRAGRRMTVSLGDHDVAAREVDGAGEVEAMRLAIATLPEALRETLELRLREELSYAEIAAVLDLPVGTVRSRLHTAVKLLREMMGGD